MKKRLFLFLTVFLLLNIISAMDLDVSVKPISDSYIIQLNKPALYDLVIKNNGINDEFKIYSLVGVNINPSDSIKISSGETKTIKIEAIPQSALRDKKGFFTFEYIIQNSQNEIRKEKLSMNIADLSDSLFIVPENINPKSDKMVVSVKNILMNDFTDLKINLDSAFFSYEKNIPLKSLETTELDIPIDVEKLKSLSAGQYIINVKVSSEGKIDEKEITFKFLEQENIDSSESKEGILIRRIEITKNNLGNVRKSVNIQYNTNLIYNIISYPFTTYNINPSKSEIKGFTRYNGWEKELNPSEQLKVIIKTNWLYPILIIILIIAIVILVKRYTETDIVLRKNVSYVNTKGGEFALKVQLRVKAKRFVERIKVVDKIPPIVTLYEKFGAVTPDKVDLENKRLEWNIEALNAGEERIFSYIVYSKIGVVGKFELPPAKVIYERDGEIKDNVSNKSYFINEPKKFGRI